MKSYLARHPHNSASETEKDVDAAGHRPYI